MVRLQLFFSRRRCVLAAAVLGTLLAVVLTGWCSFGRVCTGIRKQTLRLHVLANSDSQQDQALKLLVRDALSEECAALFAGITDMQQAETAARQALPQLRETAQHTVAAAGFDCPVEVSLETVWFDTRTYGEYTLPAGRYRALQVKLGEAQGKNWWCCLFPPLCVAAASGQSTAEAAESIWGAAGVRVAAGGGYEVRFALLEWLEKLRDVKN